MTFTPSHSTPPGWSRRHQEYLNLREQYSKYGSIPQLQKLNIQMRVFSLLLMKGEKYVEAQDNLRHLQAEIIQNYMRRFIEQGKFKSQQEVIFCILKLESSVGRAIRKIREDDAMTFHPKTYAGKSPKYDDNFDSHGETAIEELKGIE